MKYCKFKSIDITKCLNSGVTPKRGNPNETNQEDNLEKELKDLNQHLIEEGEKAQHGDKEQHIEDDNRVAKEARLSQQIGNYKNILSLK